MAYIPNLPKLVSKNPRKILCENPRVFTEGNLRFGLTSLYTDKKENKFSSYIKKFRWSSCKVKYRRQGFLIYEEMHKYLTIYEKAVNHI